MSKQNYRTVTIKPDQWIPWAKSGKGVMKKKLMEIMEKEELFPEVNAIITYDRDGTLRLRGLTKESAGLITTPDSPDWPGLPN